MKANYSIVVCSALFLFSFTLGAQVEIAQAIELTGTDGSRVVRYLEAPIDRIDTAKKDYVDNAASASGGGGGLPTMISTESGAAMFFVDAVAYCVDLTEVDHSDWRLPTLTESLCFTRSSMSSNYVWTLSPFLGLDYAVNQNYISARLNDGEMEKWRSLNVLLSPSWSLWVRSHQPVMDRSVDF